MNTEEKIEVMQAFLDGKTIEITDAGDDDWGILTKKNPDWDWDRFNYRIKPKPHPMEKYIELGLDMELGNNSKSFLEINTLKKINSGNIFIANSNNIFDFCRLRPNHAHYIKDINVNPVPDNCQFRLSYINETGSWSSFADCRYSENVNWREVVLLEVRYPS